MITQEYIKKVFEYKNGELIRRVKTSSRAIVGRPTNYKSQGYLMTKVQGQAISVHRIIWLYHHGYLPENEIDHIDQNKLNNKIENLREVSHACNIRNRGNSRNNKSGIKGVRLYPYRNKNEWISVIHNDGEIKTLGYSKSLDEAVLLRLAAEQCLGWTRCNSNSPAYQYAINRRLIKKS